MMSEESSNLDELLKEADNYTPYVPLKRRKALKEDLDATEAADRQISLFDKVAIEKIDAPEQKQDDHVQDIEKILKEEEDILRSIAEQTALMGAKEIATGTIYTEPLITGWKPPMYVQFYSEEDKNKLYSKFEVRAEGSQIPMMLTSFPEMRLPRSIVRALAKKGIEQPTPIQMQGIPTVLSGRDVIAIAHTGSGKSLVFILPLLLFCMEQQFEMPLIANEGPYGLIVVPSRELANQIYDNILYFAEAIHKYDGIDLKTTLCIGGEPLGNNISSIGRGTHIVVATPGRLLALLNDGIMRLDSCRYLCMDEADRMIDLKFEAEMRSILAFFKDQRQTLLFSATMPKKIQNFARSALVEPITINIGRPGAANLNIIQDVMFVREEDKLTSLLESLQKTAPPVLIFAMKKSDVDYIHEYLLFKGITAVGIHGDKGLYWSLFKFSLGTAQSDRIQSISEFKRGQKDVLVATDIASKGLDFPEIQHVINYDMPPDIEDYVHRIGRTGRHKKSGLATTLLSKSSDGPVLLDLKHLLIEAKQKVPEFLAALQDHISLNEFLTQEAQGCSYCGGLGHRITDCNKLETLKTSKIKELDKKNTFYANHTDW